MTQSAVQVAELMIETFQWQSVRPQSLGPHQARIVLDDKWVKVTTTPADTSVLLHTGLVHDGTLDEAAGKITVEPTEWALVTRLEDLWQALGWGPVVMSLTDAAQHILDEHDEAQGGHK